MDSSIEFYSETVYLESALRSQILPRYGMNSNTFFILFRFDSVAKDKDIPVISSIRCMASIDHSAELSRIFVLGCRLEAWDGTACIGWTLQIEPRTNRPGRQLNEANELSFNCDNHGEHHQTLAWVGIRVEGSAP